MTFPKVLDMPTQLNDETIATQSVVSLAHSSDVKLAYDYAWGWFSYHAEQRMQLFNFSIVVLGALGTGYATSLAQGWYITATAMAIFGILCSRLFLALDKRNSQLTKMAESWLKIHFEPGLAKKCGEEICFTTLADAPRPKNTRSFSQSLGSLHWFFQAFMITGVLIALASLAATNKIGMGEVWETLNRVFG